MSLLMASSTAFHPQEIELPRYRGSSKGTEVQPTVTRYDSISSSVSQTDGDTDVNIDTDLSQLATQRPITKTLIFTRPVFRSDMTISNASGPAKIPLYHAATTEWNFYKPDLTLYAGGDATWPVLALSHFRWSRDARMGIGDPADEANLVWEELKNTSPYYGHNKYIFSFSDAGKKLSLAPTSSTSPLPPPSYSLIPTTNHNDDINSSSTSQRRHLMWQRTTAAAEGVEGFCAWLSRRHYKLIDLETGDVMAVFIANNIDSMTKKGELRMFVHVSKEVEMMIVLTMAVISEKATRRTRHQQRRMGSRGF